MENTTVKYTKRDKYNAIKAMFADGSCDIDATVIIEFCDAELAALDNKAVKAKEFAAKKKSEDELTEIVFGVLTEEPATIADITKAIGDENVTVSKVQYRLGQLAKAERAVKSEITIPGGEGVKTRKIVAYARA